MMVVYQRNYNEELMNLLNEVIQILDRSLRKYMNVLLKLNIENF